MKKKFFAVALAAVLALGSAVSAFADAPEGSIGYLSFDETIDSATAVVQGSGGIVGAASDKTDWEYVDGIVGKALHVSPYVVDADGNDISDHVGLDTGITVGSGDFTISFWAKADGVGFAAPLVWVGNSDQVTNGEHWIGVWSGFGSAWNGGTSGASTNSTEYERQYIYAEFNGAKASSFDWTYITLTMNQETSEATLYLDGMKLFSTDKFSPLAEDAKVYVGANAWDAPCDFTIDELSVFDKVLTAEEVDALYEASQTPVETPSDDTSSDDTSSDDADASTPASEDGENNSNPAVIIVVVVVVVVIVAVVAVLASKKKKK